MKNHSQKIKVGISVGDTNGIGAEIILKTFEKKGMLEFFTPIIFGSTKFLGYYKAQFNTIINFNGINHPKDALPNKLNVVNIWRDALEIEPGKPTPQSGKYAFESLSAATKALQNNTIEVLVTAPIDKQNIQSKQFNFQGHTEYLEDTFNSKSLMFMIHDDLKIGLVTNHLPIQAVSQNITQDLIVQKAKIMLETLKQDFQINKPKIALLGLNPHNGDGGLIGNEEMEIIIPAIKTLQNEGHLVFGPYAADGFFGSGEYRPFDAVLAMYHDQGLIAFKQISFGQGVNFTAALPVIRTSPDHGTAFDIAGQGKADESSFEEALFKAVELYKNRSESIRLSQNKLQKQIQTLNQKFFKQNLTDVEYSEEDLRALESE